MQIPDRVFRWVVSGALCGSWLLAFQAGCSSSDGASISCGPRCADLCKALGTCGNTPADCEAQCTLGLGSDCSGPPADQLTCNELSATYACADYCATLCTRAPECGSFDSKKCAVGCAAQSPTICNSASVAARTCDQLKPEVRSYQDTADFIQSSNGGSVSVGPPSSGPHYGLCASGSDCSLPLGCSTATNTCAPCESDADCAQPYLHYACSDAHECTKVQCVVDADCSALELCDTVSHVCGECHTDADCKKAIVGKVCDQTTLKCVSCVDNGDCSVDAPRCDVAGQYCTSCKSDADCRDRPDTPFCDYSCVQCKQDADCADPAHPTCNYDETCK